MKSDGGFHFNLALTSVNTAINVAGEYSSAPAHDDVSEVDLKAYRAFLNLLNGNTGDARGEALSIQNKVTGDGNRGSVDALAVVMAFTD